VSLAKRKVMHAFKTTFITFVGAFLIGAAPVAPEVTTSSLNLDNARASAGYLPACANRAPGDPEGSAEYALVGIAKINGSQFAINCLQNGARLDDAAGPGRGSADIFDSAGRLIRRFAVRDNLNSPPQIVEYVLMPAR
jgi:hypothetical protein